MRRDRIPERPAAAAPASTPAIGSPSPLDGNARSWLSALEHGEKIEAPVCVIAAHPDDETLGVGGRLGAFERLTLVHVTDGAPEDPGHALRAGFASRETYSRARAAELDEALRDLGVAPRRVSFGLTDQAAVSSLTRLVHNLAPELRRARMVLTHAYEGGHPDHDATAFAVQAACALLDRAGERAPLRLEFAGYHSRARGRVTGQFWPDAERPAVRARLRRGELARKTAALARFRTQAEVIAWFSPAEEAYREAPVYDFTAPPPPGRALYDDWGWSMTSARWRGLAAEALDALGPGAVPCR